MNMFRRLVFVYGGIAVLYLVRVAKRLLVRMGEMLKALGRTFVALGEDHTREWGIELLLRCYLVDAEFHIGPSVYRGPVYAAYRSFKGGDWLVFNCNWIAKSHVMRPDRWDYSGACAFRLGECGPPARLPNGDYHFAFDGGWGVLLLSEAQSRLRFTGEPDTPREFAYF